VYFLTNSRLSDNLTTLEWLSGIVACLAHDVGHLGTSNRFLINSGHELALNYNDISVLEMMHASTVFQVLKSENFNIFASLQPDKMAQVRKLIIDMILATDLAKHFDILSFMRTKYSENSDLSNRDARADVFRLCLKCADVGHSAKSLELHEKWCILITEEFFEQGDEEKKLGLPVSMFCDKETANISKSQVGFLRNIASPLFNTLSSILASEEVEKACLMQLKHNEAYWEALGKQRNLSSINSSKLKSEKNIFPLLKRKTLRKGSLPQLTMNINRSGNFNHSGTKG
jgi:hypothetical protein